MNILLALLKFPPDFTGAGLRNRNLYRRLMLKGVKNVHVITTKQDTALISGGSDSGMVVSSVIHNPFVEKQKGSFKKIQKAVFVSQGVFLTALEYFKLFKKIDIVHTVDSSWLSSTVAWCAMLTRKPLVKEIVLLGDDDPLTLRKKSPLWRWFFLRSFHDANLVITISSPLKQACLEYGLPENKVWCRPNPLYFDASTTAEVPLDLNFKIPTILWVGKLSPRKNAEFLLQAAKFLKDKLQLLFVGPCEDAEYFNTLKQIASEVERNTLVKVIFLGRIDDRAQLRQFYEKSSLFWFASHKEGLGNVVIESLLAGTPVVALPIDGIMKSLIVDERDGEIVDTEDPIKFAEVVNRCLYSNTYDRNLIAERARQRFDPGRIEDQTMEHFRRIIGEDLKK